MSLPIRTPIRSSDESEILRSRQPLTEKRRVLCVAGGNGPELLELGEEVLDQVPGLVEVFVKGARYRAGFARWDHRCLTGFSKRLEHPLVGIERFVGNERFGLKVGQQGIGSSQIVLLTPGEMKAGRIAERIDGGVDFGAQPSARASDGLILTPLFTCSRAVLGGARCAGGRARWWSRSSRIRCPRRPTGG